MLNSTLLHVSQGKQLQHVSAVWFCVIALGGKASGCEEETTIAACDCVVMLH